MLTLTGGEPLLRADLEKIAIQFGDRVCIMLNTTGSGLTAERARGLRASGIFGIGVSLDSADEDEHDRLRGKSGAFKVALKALETASKNGLYPYVVTVATHDLLLHGRFESFMNFVADHGALEIHLLTPCPTGRLAGNSDALLTQNEKKQILAYQREVAQREDLPILSTFLYLESQEAFGCGAGLTHLYIDGSGEVCPCNFVPASFGNVTNEPLKAILERMAEHFQKPRTGCVGHVLNRHISGKRLPLDPESSSALCERYLPKEHSVPRFFKIRNDEQGSVGREELRTAYDGIHHYYDEFWLSEARKPVEELLKMLPDHFRRVFEAGCGTGFATCMIAEKIGQATCIIAADISEGMLSEAKKRIEAHNISGVNFNHGDALEILRREKDFDLIFSSWVLGYIPLKEFFASVRNALSRNGLLAFVVHKQDSPYEHLRIFRKLVAEDPSVLTRQVYFDFPRDTDHVRTLLENEGLEAISLWEGKITFEYKSAAEVLDHLLKSGAGTAFYNALVPEKRRGLETRFLEVLSEGVTGGKYLVAHDYISCIVRKP